MSKLGEPTYEERYIEATKQLRKSVKLLEGMAAWKTDLAHRIWRAEIALRGTGDPLYDMEELQREVRIFNDIVGLLKARGIKLDGGSGVETEPPVE